jgi:hypothetical protein
MLPPAKPANEITCLPSASTEPRSAAVGVACTKRTTRARAGRGMAAHEAAEIARRYVPEPELRLDGALLDLRGRRPRCGCPPVLLARSQIVWAISIPARTPRIRPRSSKRPRSAAASSSRRSTRSWTTCRGSTYHRCRPRPAGELNRSPAPAQARRQHDRDQGFGGLLSRGALTSKNFWRD